jgi:hypothetical protein
LKRKERKKKILSRKSPIRKKVTIANPLKVSRTYD